MKKWALAHVASPKKHIGEACHWICLCKRHGRTALFDTEIAARKEATRMSGMYPEVHYFPLEVAQPTEGEQP